MCPMRRATELDPTQGAPLCAWCAELQGWTPPRGPLYVPDAPSYRVWPHPRGPSMFLTHWTTEKDPRQRSPLKGLKGQSYGERLAKQAFWFPGWKKRLLSGHDSCCGGSQSPRTLDAAMVPASQAAAPPSRSTLTGAELPQAKNVLHLFVQGRFSRVDSLRPCRLWPARLLCRGGGFSRQEYWSYWPRLVAIPF